MKYIKSLIILCLTFAGIAVSASAAGVDIFSHLPHNLGDSSLMATFTATGMAPEVWTKEFVKRFNHADENSFLDGIPDYSNRVVDGNIIHLIDFGCDPDVIVDAKGSDYPIGIQDMDNADLVISLTKLQTKATPITDDVLNDIKAEFLPAVIEAHRVRIAERRLDTAIFNFAPAKNADKTPVLTTTGEADGTRRRFSRADVIALKKRFDDLSVPSSGRRLVLCTEHVADLLMLDQAFAEQYYNYSSGAISRMYGFDIYEHVAMPYYTAAGNKKAFGAATTATDMQASVAFYAPRMAKATGDKRQYISRSESDPLYQRTLYNVREYFFAAPKKEEGIAAIYSGTVATENA